MGRRRDLYRRERELTRRTGGPVAGVDEVGRGPLAGPVVAAAVILPEKPRVRGLDDSKALTAEEREALFRVLRERAEAIAIGWASSGQVDRLNILRASHLAMARAIERLRLRPSHLLVDGLPVEGLPVAQTAVIKGDARCACIGAASIVAKVVRDRLMVRLGRRYPAYGFERHKGYATEEHLQALAKLGPCVHHRMSFAPAREALMPGLFA